MNIWLQKPRNNREWEKDQQVLATTTFQDNIATIHNIRNFTYRSQHDYIPGYYDQSFDIEGVKEVWLGIVPFSKFKLMVHTLVVFKFNDGKEVVFSVEVRKLKNFRFSSWKTALSLYELMYVIADPKDVVDLRNVHRENEPVHLHLLNISLEKRRQLFVSMLKRANKLAEHPEFFNLIWNSCGSNVVGHLNEVLDDKISWLHKYIAPGYLLKDKAIQKVLA